MIDSSWDYPEIHRISENGHVIKKQELNDEILEKEHLDDFFISLFFTSFQFYALHAGKVTITMTGKKEALAPAWSSSSQSYCHRMVNTNYRR